MSRMTRRRAASVRPFGVGGLDAALGDGDQPLDERPQLLGLRHRGHDALVPQQRLGLVAQQRHAVLGGPAELSMCKSVSHDRV